MRVTCSPCNLTMNGVLGNCRFVISVVMAGSMLTGACSAIKESGPAPKPEVVPPPPHQARIADSVLTPYTPDQYPDTFREYGSRISDVERFRRLAAEKASRSEQCNEVIASEISSMQGSVQNMSFFVDCENGTRFRFNESELASTTEAPPLSESQKAWNELDAKYECAELIRQQAAIPTSVSINSLTGTRSRKAATTGIVVVNMDFDARNVFNAKIGYAATCYFKPGQSQGTIEIRQRMR